MATYACGDIHGHDRIFDQLLAELSIDLSQDRLWLVGDLVNRGPSSLAVLRRVRDLHLQLGDRLQVVLGNHDLHFLARAWGVVGSRPKDTLDEALAAPDLDELVTWLRTRPLLHRSDDQVLVHAGLLPAWTIGEAEERARRLEALLAGDEGPALLGRWRRRGPPVETERDLTVFSLLRTCRLDGTICSHKGPSETAPDGCLPWFEVPGRRSAKTTLVFGHWAALGLRLQPGVVALDSGVAWGGALTAVRLEDRRVFQVSVR